MASVRRAILTGFAIVIVTMALIVGHGLLPNHSSAARSPKLHGPVGLGANGLGAVAIAEACPLAACCKDSDADAPCACSGCCTRDAATAPEKATEKAPQKTAEKSGAPTIRASAVTEPAAPPLPLAPAPLPNVMGGTRLGGSETFCPFDCCPAADLAGQVRVSDGSAKGSTSAAQGRQLVEKGLPNSTAEERELFYDVVKDLPAHDLREVLRLREQIGGVAGSHGLLHSSPLFPSANIAEPSSPADPAAAAALRDALVSIARAREVIAHNIANVNTVGYKRRVPIFERVAPPTSAALLQTAGSSAASAKGSATSGDATIDMSAGRVRPTGRSLDLAIEGDGFFQVRGADGSLRYTRCGRLVVNESGQIAIRLAGGDCPLEPAVQVPKGVTEIHVSRDGDIKIEEPNTAGLVLVGAIPLVRFLSPSDLRGEGETLSSREAAGVPDVGPADTLGRGRIRQGCLEDANVDLTIELAELQQLDHQRQALKQAARLLQ